MLLPLDRQGSSTPPSFGSLRAPYWGFYTEGPRIGLGEAYDPESCFYGTPWSTSSVVPRIANMEVPEV